MRLVFLIAKTVHGALYRLSGGRLGSHVAGLPVLLLTTTGRKTGKPRTVPLSYYEDGDALVVVGSKGGAPRHPAWYLNLEANPEVEIQVFDEVLPAVARTTIGEERERLWALMRQTWPAYDEYQTRTDREIPVVVLTPKD